MSAPTLTIEFTSGRTQVIYLDADEVDNGGDWEAVYEGRSDQIDHRPGEDAENFWITC